MQVVSRYTSTSINKQAATINSNTNIQTKEKPDDRFSSIKKQSSCAYQKKRYRIWSGEIQIQGQGQMQSQLQLQIKKNQKSNANVELQQKEEMLIQDTILNQNKTETHTNQLMQIQSQGFALIQEYQKLFRERRHEQIVNDSVRQLLKLVQCLQVIACPICYEAYNLQNKKPLLLCYYQNNGQISNHSICQSCWLNQNAKTCPFCRKIVRKQPIHNKQFLKWLNFSKLMNLNLHQVNFNILIKNLNPILHISLQNSQNINLETYIKGLKFQCQNLKAASFNRVSYFFDLQKQITQLRKDLLATQQQNQHLLKRHNFIVQQFYNRNSQLKRKIYKLTSQKQNRQKHSHESSKNQNQNQNIAEQQKKLRWFNAEIKAWVSKQYSQMDQMLKQKFRQQNDEPFIQYENVKVLDSKRVGDRLKIQAIIELDFSKKNNNSNNNNGKNRLIKNPQISQIISQFQNLNNQIRANKMLS